MSSRPSSRPLPTPFPSFGPDPEGTTAIDHLWTLAEQPRCPESSNCRSDLARYRRKMNSVRSHLPTLIKMFSLLVATLAIFGYCNYLRLEAARAKIRSSGPSEFTIGLKLGFNPRCGLTFISVGFWQQGPGIPERQGYICGGVLTSAEMRLVPFDAGLVLNDDL